MSQDSILKLLKKHPKGITSGDLIKKYKLTRTAYTSLRKLRQNGEVKTKTIRFANAWTTLYFTIS